MHPTQFQRIFDDTIASVASLAFVKSGEYASQADTDRLSNFKDAGKRLMILPEKVLLTYLDKHYAAIMNFVEDLTKNRSRPRSESINGRADDLILYAILLKCLLAERASLQEAMESEDQPEFHQEAPPGPRLVWDDASESE